MTSIAGTCPSCGTTLPPDAPKGFCPRCLYRLGFDQQANPCLQPSPLSPDNPHHPTFSTLFGDYELLEEIGVGGAGVVYKARQKSLDRIVALKLLLFGPHAPAETVKRFRSEAVATAALQHPNIVAIHEVGFCAGQHFIAMDYVPGQCLSALIRGTPLPARQAARYVQAIAEAVHYAHERGILHRDLKPANILIDANDQPRVTDFGLAKRLDDTRLSTLDSELTVTGQVLGSPNYMPPEQATAKRSALSRRTDVYGLGAVLYHALTGRPPFTGETLAHTVQQVLNSEPLPPHVLNPSLPIDLETICLKCLEKEPARRYATAQMVAQELGRFLGGQPVLARPVGQLAKGWRWCRRNPVVASLIAALVLALIGGFAAVLAEVHRAKLAELVAKKNAYIAEMNLARQALEASNLGRARALLERYRPPAGSQISNLKFQIPTDLRGWEWRWLWQRCQTQERTTLPGASNQIGSVALSADGQWLAALSNGDALRLWDLASRRCVGRRPDQSFHRNQILFAADGHRLFAGNYEAASVKIWSVPSLEAVGELHHQSPVDWIALSADGRILAAADCAEVKIWDTTALRELAAIPAGHDLRHGRVALSRNGRRVACNDSAGRIYVWDWPSRQPLAELAGHTRVPPWESVVHDLAFTPDGQQLLSTGPDRTVRLWDLGSCQEIRQLSGHSANVTSLAFAPDGATLATASCDQTIRLWDVATWHVRATLRGHQDEVWRVVFSADGNTLATGSKDETVKLWDAHPAPERELSWAVPAGTRTIAFAADAGAIGVLAADGAFHLLNAATWQEALTRPLRIPGDKRLKIALDPRATCLVASSDEGPLRTWRLPDATAGADFVGHVGPLEAVGFSEDGRWLASAGADQTLRLWQADTRRQVAQFPKEHPLVTSIVLSPNGSLLGATYDDDQSEIWDCATGRRLAVLKPRKSGQEIIFLHGSSRFITGGSDGTIAVWDLRTLRCGSRFRGSLHGVNSLAVTPDQRTLTAGTGEGAINLWDLELGQEVAVLKGHRESVSQLAISRDGRTLLSASQDAVYVWEAPSLEEIDAAEKAKDHQAY